MTYTVWKAMDEKKISMLVLMDMSKAFDSINLNTLLEVFKLRSLGVSPSALEWIVCFYWGCGFAVSPSWLYMEFNGVHSWPCSAYFLHKWFIKPFAPEPPVTADAGPCASTAGDIISFNGHEQLVTANLCRVKRSFKPYQNEHNSVKDTAEKGKKPCM